MVLASFLINSIARTCMLCIHKLCSMQAPIALSNVLCICSSNCRYIYSVDHLFNKSISNCGGRNVNRKTNLFKTLIHTITSSSTQNFDVSSNAFSKYKSHGLGVSWLRLLVIWYVFDPGAVSCYNTTSYCKAFQQIQ